jgi:hypothetical protein
MEEMTEPNAKNWLFVLMGSLSHDQFIELVVSLWAIWTAWRKAIHEDIFQSPISTHGFIMSYLKEIRQLAKTLSASPRVTRNREAEWIPLPSNQNKINVDAAVSKTGGKGASAALCRNSSGVYVGASAMVYEGISDPTTLEARACREALALSEDLALTRIHVASDCSSVVSDIQGGSLGKIGSIISRAAVFIIAASSTREVLRILMLTI